MAAGMGSVVAKPREPNSLLRGPAAAAPPRPLTRFPSPGAARRGQGGLGSPQTGALEAPSSAAGLLYVPPGRGAGAPSWRRGAGGCWSGSPPPAALSLSEARPVAPAGPHPAFVSLPGGQVTAPVRGPRLARGPAPVTAAARSRRRDRRRAGRRVNSSCRGRERNFAFRGPGGGRSGAGVSRAPGRRGRDGAVLTWRASRE